LNLVEDYGYKPEDKSRLRKQALKKIIVSLEFDKVIESLINLYKNSSGYKKDRICSDGKWLCRELDKGRFTSQRFTPESIKSEITDYKVYNK
jgi:hypothetical protein